MNDTLYPIMYIEVNLISILLVLVIGRKTAGLSKMVSHRDFVNAICAMISFFVSDTVCVTMTGGLLPFVPIVLLLFKAIYFISTSAMCFFWFIYYEHIQDSSFAKSKRSVFAASCLVWAMAVVVIINISNGVLFYIDENNKYCRGSMFNLLYLLSYPYVMITFIRSVLAIFRRENYAKRNMLRKLALFPLAPAASGIVQYFRPEIPVACATLSLATLELYLEWTDRMISVDPLTMLGNRKQMEYFYKQWQEDSDSDTMFVMMADANKFKSINDIYGHVEGDAALVRIANAMRTSCREMNRRANIARFGGDEFVIMVCTDDETVISKLRMRLDECLEQMNTADNSPYELRICVGVAIAKRSSDLEEIIQQADAKLYEEKARLGHVR